MSERNERRGGLEVPDLELEPAVPKRPLPGAPRAGAVSAPAAQPEPTRGRELDLDAGPGIALQTGAASGYGDPSFGGGYAENSFAEGDDDFELIQTGSKVELATAMPQQAAAAKKAARAAAWPTGRCLPSDQLPIDPMEVALVADYGPAPSSSLLTPLYAYRVYSRRRLLQRAIAEHHGALEREEAERDTALARLTTELRPSLEASDGFRRLLAPIRDVERLAGERSAALSQADQGYREQMAKFDQELAQLGQLAGQIRAVVGERSAAAESTGNDFRRADARHKRVQIEMRGVMDVARQALGPAGGDIPAPQAAQLAELQKRLQALEPELAAAQAAHASKSSELQQAEADLARTEGQLRQIERQKGTAGSTLEQQLSLRAAGVSDAEKQMRDALAEVARGVLLARGGVVVPDATLQALLALDARVEAQAVRLETHVRALDCQDHARVRQGVTLGLAAVGLVVLAITLKAVL